MLSKLFVFICIVSFPFYSNAGWHDDELFVLTKDIDSSYLVKFKMEAVSSVWSSPANKSFFFLTDDYNIGYYPQNGNIGNTDVNAVYASTDGFDFCHSIEGTSTDAFGFGLYKFTVIASEDYGLDNAYFYIDYRDTELGGYSSLPLYYHHTDFWILYDGDHDKFYYHKIGTIDLDIISGGWTEITNGETLKIWEMKEQQSAEIDGFWQNGLNVDEQNGHPHLYWGSYPSSSETVTGYKIYKKINSGSFQYLTTVSGSLEYTDASEDFISGPYQLGEQVAYYKIIAQFDAGTSAYSNIVEARVEGAPEFSTSSFFEENEVKINSFNLNQNYPNPFNPETAISFTIPSDEFVNLSVYNTAGKLVSTLKNQKMNAGNYDVAFNASELPSGLYIYTIRAGSLFESKKMLLLK